MGDPITTALVIGGVQGGLSFAQASAQNDAVSKAGETEKVLNSVSASRKRTRNAVEFAALDGALKTTASARGVSGSRTATALQNSAYTAAAANQSGITLDELFRNYSIDSRVSAQTQNPLFAAFSSALGGYQTGLSLSSFGSSGGSSGTGQTEGFAPPPR